MSGKSAYMEMLRILPYLTVLHVVPFRILEASFKILLNVLEGSIVLLVEAGLNLVESNRCFD